MNTAISDTVREKYAEAARRVANGDVAACGCGPSATGACCDPITSKTRAAVETRAITVNNKELRII